MTLEARKAEGRATEQQVLLFLLDHAAQAATGTVAERAGVFREKLAESHRQELAGWPDLTPVVALPVEEDVVEADDVEKKDPEDLETAERLAQSKHGHIDEPHAHIDEPQAEPITKVDPEPEPVPGDASS